MRRDVLISCVKDIVDDLKSSGLVEMVDRMIERGRDSPREKRRDFGPSLPVLSDYFQRVRKYGRNHLQVLDIIDLSEITTPVYWEDFFAEPADPPTLFRLRSHLRFAVENLPKILGLLDRGYSTERAEWNEEPGDDGDGVLSVLLIEEDGEVSTTERVVVAIKSITDLYSAIVVKNKLGDTSLRLLACDSGSDKEFIFSGVAAAIKELRETIIAIWDRKVFYRHTHLTSSVGLIAESLPVLTEIEHLAVQGTISREQGELIKRKIVEGAVGFLQSGIVTSDMERLTAQSPRALMRPEQRLLSAPDTADRTNESPHPRKHARSAEGDSPVESTDGSPGDPTEDEIRRVEDFLRRGSRDLRGRRQSWTEDDPEVDD